VRAIQPWAHEAKTVVGSLLRERSSYTAWPIEPLWTTFPLFKKREHPDISLRLHASIRRQLKKGATNPSLIAAEAVSDLHIEVVTYKSDARTRRKPNGQTE
jgi:hypothetical protein